MWKKFLGSKAKIIGVDLNPDAKKFEKFGFKIFIGDQADPNFWKKFYNKNGKIDILIDDGGHTNLQQITALMESIENIKNDGLIIIEDTHTSFMNYKGFKNPSDYSLINFTNKIIENLHRRNPMIKKKMNLFSKKISSIEYFDSIVIIKISNKKYSYSKNLHNNKYLMNNTYLPKSDSKDYKLFFNYSTHLHITYINIDSDSIDTFFPFDHIAIKENFIKNNTLQLSNTAQYTQWIKK